MPFKAIVMFLLPTGQAEFGSHCAPHTSVELCLMQLSVEASHTSCALMQSSEKANTAPVCGMASQQHVSESQGKQVRKPVTKESAIVLQVLS
eukprot:2156874-Amphidinium_carterae.1